MAGGRWNRDAGELFYTAATNRPAPRVDDTGVRSIRRLVQRSGGTRQAAARFGVSQRTVQRWVAKNAAARGRPNPASADRIREAARAERRADVQRAAAGRRAARMRTTGATLKVAGTGGPDGSDENRYRRLDLELTGDQVDELYGAIAAGDDEARETLNGFYADWLEREQSGATHTWAWTDIDDLSLSDDPGAWS